MHDSSHTHREIVAAVASLKSCLRSVVLAVAPATTAGSGISDSKIAGSIQRANEAISKLDSILSAVADQTLRLPLETSKRLVDVGLPELLHQLLHVCQVHAAWPPPGASGRASLSPTQSNTPTSDEGKPLETAVEDGGSTTMEPVATAAAAAAQACSATVPAALHPCWAPMQQLMCAVFGTLSVLTAVLIRACTRSADPAVVLMQLASPDIMEAQVTYMQALNQHAANHQAEDGTTRDEHSLGAYSMECAPACLAAFTSIYSLLAAATDAQSGLDQVRQQLMSSLCSTQLLPVAAELLLRVPAYMQPKPDQLHDLEVHCQAAGWQLLTLSLFLSGAPISVTPECLTAFCVQPGQPLPSSMLAASIRAEACEQPTQPLDLSEAFAAAGLASTPSRQEQLLSPPVLSLLQERLYHCVTELRGSYGASSIAVTQHQRTLQETKDARLQLLPGRCCPAEQDVLHAALRALRCWRALLLSPAAPTLPLISSFGVQLLLTLLSGVLAEPIRAGSSEREALRGRVIRVAVHCLQLQCSCLTREVLFEHLQPLVAALAGVISTAGGYWDNNKRAVKSEALPYTGQVRCVDKATGDMMVRYTMAAQSALDLLRQLLATCRMYAALPVGDVCAGGARVTEIMLAAGVLPAIEQLFRQLPVVSPAHEAAAVYLVELLPLCLHEDIAAGQLPLLATLRKFIFKSVGIAEPDRQAAMSTTTQFAALLGSLASMYATHCSFGVCAPPAADALLQHAAGQLLPALQAFVTYLLKAPIPAPHNTHRSSCTVAAAAAALSSTGAAPEAERTHLLPVLLSTYQQLAALAKMAPQLQLAPLLLSCQTLHTMANMLSSNYWLLPGFLAASTCADANLRQSPTAASTLSAAAGSARSAGPGAFTGQFAVQAVLQVAEALLAPGAAGAQAVTSEDAASDSPASKVLRTSCSADCLCALKRNEGSEACQIGNPKCGTDGWCCCSSPKACSDITAPQAGSKDCTDTQTQAEACLLLMVLSEVLQSRLLPELCRVAQQLPAGTAAGTNKASTVPFDTAAASMLAPLIKPGSTGTLSVNVPQRKGLHQRDVRGGVSPPGISPKGHSPHGHSVPLSATISSSLRSQPSSVTQSFLSAYMGDMPATALGVGSAGTGYNLRVTTNSSRFASSGSNALGSSPKYADDGAFGLLRAGSSGSTINWTAGASLLQEAGVRVAARDSGSGFGSSPSLASLASPHAVSDGASPFVLDQPAVALGPGAASMPLDGAGGGGSCTPMQHRLDSLLLLVAHRILALADAGRLGPEVLQRRPSGSSAGGESDTGTPYGSNMTASLPKPALYLLGSGQAAGNSLSGSFGSGMSRPLSGVGAGPTGLTGISQHSSNGPRLSCSGSGHYGSLTVADMVAHIRCCLAAVAASAVVPAPCGAAQAEPVDTGTGKAYVSGAQGGSPAHAAADSQTMPAGKGTGADSAVEGDSQVPSSPLSSESLSVEPSNADVIFPVELGLSQLNVAPAAATAAAPGPAPPCTPATPELRNPLPSTLGGKQGPVLLPVELMRRLQGALVAAGPALARYSSGHEPDVVSLQLLLAKLTPKPVGCWNTSCTNMPGVSEAKVAGKPCTSCRVAAFCSKACEKQAWSEHTTACSKLAALSAAASVAGSTV